MLLRHGEAMEPKHGIIQADLRWMMQMATDRDKGIFEAGIKLGALYHQWVGTPISRQSAGSVETAIEKAVILQPFVEEITVRLNRDLMTENRIRVQRTHRSDVRLWRS